MALPTYITIYDHSLSGTYWKQAAIAVANAQRGLLAGPAPLSADKVAWCNRDPGAEGRRILLLLLGTNPLLQKLIDNQSFLDSDFDQAMGNLLPNLLKAVVTNA